MKQWVLLVFLCVTACAQSSQFVTTADGRRVELRPNGTWTYLDNAPAPVTAGTIEIEAAIIMRNSEVRPVARSEFFLLDADLNTILNSAGFKTGWLHRRDTPANTFWYLLAAAARGNLLGGQKELLAAREAIKSHVIGTVTTGFDGKAKLENVKPGKYFLIGSHYHPVTKQVPCWELPVEVAGGKAAKVFFDSNNATSWGN